MLVPFNQKHNNTHFARCHANWRPKELYNTMSCGSWSPFYGLFW